jgi:glycosyltransferase involved in cell wall biosynthesis
VGRDRDDGLPARTRLGPPASTSRSSARGRAPRRRRRCARSRRAWRPRRGRRRTTPSPATRRAAGRALARSTSLRRDRHVAFVGKLIVSKGIDLLAAAWPLVLADVPDARLVVVGFGAWRAALERLLAALAAGDLDRVRAIAAEGRALEGGPRAPLRHLRAFLDSLSGAKADAYRAAAAALGERVVLTGRLEHEELAPLLAACEAQVVPSTFPEAFGMVAAEAAACGALPCPPRTPGSPRSRRRSRPPCRPRPGRGCRSPSATARSATSPRGSSRGCGRRRSCGRRRATPSSRSPASATHGRASRRA